MLSFDLGRQFDVVTCLFSAIAYALTTDVLRQAIATMTGHLAPGGVLLVEPFIEPRDWRDRFIHARFVDEPDLKAARMNVSRSEDGVAVLDFHYLIATPAGVEHFTGEHRLALFSREDMESAFRSAGLDVRFDREGLMGRGLYIGATS